MRLSLLFILLMCATGRAHGQQIGLRLSSLNKQLNSNVPETLKKVREMGFTEIEFDTTYGLTFPEFIKLLATNNLTVSGFETTFERLEKFPQSAVDEARAYGAKYIVSSWVPPAKVFTRTEADYAARVLNAAGKIISKNGLLLCYQPTGMEFLPDENETIFDYFVRQLDTRYVYLQLNVFSAKRGGQDPVALLKKYPTRFIMVDLNDRKKGSPLNLTGKTDADTYVVLGKGEAGIPEVLKAARDLGIQQFLIDDRSPEAEQQIPRSLAFLKSLR